VPVRKQTSLTGGKGSIIFAVAHFKVQSVTIFLTFFLATIM
jgi:hypothetical protein